MRIIFSDIEISAINGSSRASDPGDTLLTARKTRSPDGKPYVDHICYTLDNWNEDAVEAELKRRGLEPRPDVGGGSKSFHVKDPDGFNLQVAGPLKKS